jgi:CDGSH-type Zn-finger protein
LSGTTFTQSIHFPINFIIPIQGFTMPAKLTINPNGSIKLEGDFEIVDKQGTQYGLGGRNVVSLCRCGLSKNKPFCDGSHKGHYEHEAVAFDLPPKKEATPPTPPQADPPSDPS